MIIYVETDGRNLYDSNNRLQLYPSMMDNVNYSYVFTPDVETTFSKLTGKSKYDFFRNARFITDLNPDISLLVAATVLGFHGYITFGRLEKCLLSYDSDEIINVYSSKYATDEVLEQFTKPYGSEIVIKESIIPPSRFRSDHREFGLKYAKPGVYENLMYFDWHNFYPNIMLELGCPRNLDRKKIEDLLKFKGAKSFLNKLIGRFDAEYSLFYDPSYANKLRKFGRMKLMYYGMQSDEFIFCNTDSILARVPEGFIPPDNTSVMNVEKALIKNIGNYVLYNSDEVKTTGIFNKPEELVIAKYRMSIEYTKSDFLLSNIFDTNEDGYLSADNVKIESVDRKIRYGKSSRLSIPSLVSIQENI